ncbi:hypothetical protein Rsub_05983 [Raphidocelis subcapitata]|uniref:SHSP domain-containing protein n=1 Tax=Raphidocelis subcapitata TaxID=307507 RepID=A0A2V0P048_9CHLO|nr:hypothetical protein Rsub_05983 [Raphidocelis subcapitata]|eukprot:GBF93251.1 hypothetical protein Rsub_05983 [Raphidocelis subcapitata]
MLLARTALARGAPTAVRGAARRRGVAPLSVRAFREEPKKPKHEEPEPKREAAAAPQGAAVERREAPAPAPAHRPAAAPAPAPLGAPPSSPMRMLDMFDQMEAEMDALSRQLLGSGWASPLSALTGRARPRGARGGAGALDALASPPTMRMRLAADVAESDKEWRISLDVPGMSKDDVKVTVEEGVLTVQGERRHEHEEKQEGGRVWIERSHGHFHRAFPLPPGADADHITAAVKDGVMTVTLPKAPAPPKPPAREIAVE